MSSDFLTTHDMIIMAKRNLTQDSWDYICGAAESETGPLCRAMPVTARSGR